MVSIRDIYDQFVKVLLADSVKKLYQKQNMTEDFSLKALV